MRTTIRPSTLVSKSKRTWLVSQRVAELGESGQAAQAKEHRQTEKDDRIEADPNSVHRRCLTGKSGAVV